MTKHFIVALAGIAIAILAVIYRNNRVALGRTFQLSFFISLFFIPVFYSETGYGYDQLNTDVSENLLTGTFAIMRHSFGALQYTLLALALFCAVTILRAKKTANKAGWITYIVADVLLYLLLTGIVYDHSHTRFAFG